MKKLHDNFEIFVVILLTILILNKCSINKKIKKDFKIIKSELANMQNNLITVEDLKIENLKTEKRFIQATDRKMLDVQRQSEIEKEIEELTKK